MLKLTKDKKIISDSSEEKEVTQENILRYVFSEPVGEIDGWTFRDLMTFIEPVGMILGEMAWCRFDLFYAEMQKPAEPDKWVDNIQYILIARNIEVYNGEINEYADVSGRNDDVTEEMIQADIEKNDGMSELSNSYAIEFTPVNKLADKPIRINDRFVVRKSMMEDDEMPIIFEARKPFYLLDIIWAILWEISFAGNPTSRDEMWGEIESRAESVKDGTAKSVPIEEVFERLRNLTAGAEEAGNSLTEIREKLTEGEERPLDPANE